MTRDTILSAIRSAAQNNGGSAPGARAFHAATGITRTDLWNTGFSRYSEAVEAAGFTPNQLKRAFDTSDMLTALADFARRLERFPSRGDFKVERRKNSGFPSYEAFFRLSGGSITQLPALLLSHCRTRPDLADVVELLHGLETAPASIDTAVGDGAKRVRGYVYLAKHGRDFKIGRSTDVARRRRELALLLPQELEHVHVIETDDPEGIEQYWHRRFADRRVRGEWFRLSAEDITAFRRRRYQ